MAPHSSTLAWKIHGQRSLVGCSPWGRQESDTTERLPFHFSLSYIGEGNGNPLQCSCLENPRDGGAWWAAIYGVSQSRTRLKRLSSSSSSSRGHSSLGWLLDGIFLGEIKIVQAYTGKFPYSREFLAEYFRVKCHLYQMIHGEKGVCVCTCTCTHVHTYKSASRK